MRTFFILYTINPLGGSKEIFAGCIHTLHRGKVVYLLVYDFPNMNQNQINLILRLKFLLRADIMKCYGNFVFILTTVSPFISHSFFVLFFFFFSIFRTSHLEFCSQFLFKKNKKKKSLRIAPIASNLIQFSQVFKIYSLK